MALPTPKELKKLADACRKAGITHFKSGDIEFTLSEAPLVHKASKKLPNVPVQQHEEIESEGWDGLSNEEKLFWSVGSPSSSDESHTE